MSAPENPYQVSNFVDAVLADAPFHGGLSRQRDLLVMPKNATLPNRCVKSNVATQRRLKRTLSWHHPAIFLALLVNLLLYLLLVLAMRKTATIEIGLSDEWFARRRRAMAIGWTLVLGSLGIAACGFRMLGYRDGLAGWLLLAGGVVFVVGALYGLFASRMVAPARITDTHIFLKGVCRQYLDEFPETPVE